MPVELETGNRLTIPLVIRRLLEIKENEFLFYRIEDNKIILSKEKGTGYPIRVRKLFRITFPKTFRELYDIKPKDRFYIEVIKGEIILQRMEKEKEELTYISY